MPTSSIDGRTIEFNLDKYDAANVYNIQDTNIEVNVIITKKDGSLPNQSAKIGPINNLLHSLWESVRLTINDTPITVSPSNYPYKSYISNCISYSNLVKAAQLSTQGWYGDFSGSFGPVDENSGWVERSQLFRVNYDASKEYRKNGITLFGRLLHDLVSCESGLPPLTKVKIELDRSDDAFVLMCPKGDNEKYTIKIANIVLFVPVAQLTEPIYREINSILNGNGKQQSSIAIHYRRVEIRNISLPKNKEEYYSDSLFANCELPCKIVICFVESAKKNGTYDTNPVILI